MRLPDRLGLRMGLGAALRGRAVRTLHVAAIVALGLTAGSGQSSPGCGGATCPAGTDRYLRGAIGHYVTDGASVPGGVVRCIAKPTPAWSACPAGQIRYWQDGGGVLHPIGDVAVEELEVTRCVL